MDKWKVIKGLECCTEQAVPKCEQCPYAYHCEEGDTWVIKADALALLKEQQEEIKNKPSDNTTDRHDIVRCRNCMRCFVDSDDDGERKEIKRRFK